MLAPPPYSPHLSLQTHPSLPFPSRLTPRTHRLVGAVVNFFGFKVLPMAKVGRQEGGGWSSASPLVPLIHALPTPPSPLRRGATSMFTHRAACDSSWAPSRCGEGEGGSEV